MTNLKQKSSDERLENYHGALGILFSLVFFTMAYYCDSWTFKVILNGLGIFELISIALFICRQRVVMMTVLLYQNIFSFVPCFAFAIVVYSMLDNRSAQQFLDDFHLVSLKAFVDRNPVIFTVFLAIVWQVRIRMTSYFVVKENVIWSRNKPVHEDTSIRDALNLSAFTLFITLSYTAERKYQEAFFCLAFFELVMTFVSMCGYRYLLSFYFWYQSVMFVFPISLFAAVIYHEESPTEALLCLKSYGLESVASFIATRPIMGVTVLFIVWATRLIDAELTCIDTESLYIILKKRRAVMKNRSMKSPVPKSNLLVDPLVTV